MGKLVLDATTKSITAVLGGAVATTQPDFTAHYADATTTTFVEGANDGTLNSTTPVTLVAAPAASTRRTVVTLTVVNRDTAPVVLTVNYVSAGGTRKIWTGTLAVGATWTLDINALSLDHALMTHLAYADAGHTGFQPTITTEVSGPIAAHAALITGVHGLVFTAGKTLTLTESLTLNALPIGGLAVATGANALGSLAVGLTTQVLVGGGAGTVPAWAADLPTAVTIGSAYIYRTSGTDVPVADGGTGASTLALNGVLFGNAASAVGVTAIGAQYQVLTVGASPFVPAFSGFLLDGTSGGKTVLAVTNTKTLTLTAVDDYNLTIPATGTAALLATANVFTANQTISDTAPTLALTDTTASAKSLTIAVDGNLADLRESAGASGSLLCLDLANARVGIGTTGPKSLLEVSGTASPQITIVDTDAGTEQTRFGIRNDTGVFTINSINDAQTGSWPAFQIAKTSGAFTIDHISLFTGSSGLERVRITTEGNVGIGTTGPDRLLHPELADAVTAAVSYPLRLSHISSGTVANDFGLGIEFELETATASTNQLAGTFDWLWVDAANTTRKARAVLNVYDTAVREGLRIEASGAAPMIGVLGANAALRQAHIADATDLASAITAVNAALAALETFGWLATS